MHFARVRAKEPGRLAAVRADPAEEQESLAASAILEAVRQARPPAPAWCLSMAHCFSGRTVQGRAVRPCARGTSVTVFLHANDFDKFYLARSAAVLALIEEAMGKRAVSPEAAPETIEDYEPELPE